MNSEYLIERMKKLVRKAGQEVLVAGLTLWFCLKDKDTPLRIKTLILGDLAYLVSPIDVIPDVIPVLGFSDDMGVLAATLVAISIHVKPTHREQAVETVGRWTEGL
jgi:uncharacterized membrane protein YkvA (DUF1232 family)